MLQLFFAYSISSINEWMGFLPKGSLLVKEFVIKYDQLHVINFLLIHELMNSMPIILYPSAFTDLLEWQKVHPALLAPQFFFHIQQILLEVIIFPYFSTLYHWKGVCENSAFRNVFLMTFVVVVVYYNGKKNPSNLENGQDRL